VHNIIYINVQPTESKNIINKQLNTCNLMQSTQ